MSTALLMTSKQAEDGEIFDRSQQCLSERISRK